MPWYIFILVHLFLSSRSHPSLKDPVPTCTQTNAQTTIDIRTFTLICSTHSSGNHGNAIKFLFCDMRTTIIILSYTPVFFLYMPLLPLSALMFPWVTKSPERYVWHPNVYKATSPEGRRKKYRLKYLERKQSIFSEDGRKTESVFLAFHLSKQTICVTLSSLL